MNKTVVVKKEQVQKLMELAKQIADCKRGSFSYKRDNVSLVERYTRGLCGEQAVEDYLDTPVVEWVADTKSHDHPDVMKYGLGVKTFQSTMPALVERRQTYPQIFCRCDGYIDGTKDITVEIIGVGTPDVVMSNLDDTQVKDYRVLAKKSKSAFVGYDMLEDLDTYIKDNLS